MKNLILGVLCLGLALNGSHGWAADEAAQRIISKSFAVGPGGELSVDADLGDIEVLTGAQDAVEIVVERVASNGSESQAAKLFKNHHVTFKQDGKDVGVRAETVKATGFFSHPDLTVHFRIKVPKRFNVSLTTAGGNIRVAGLNGTVDARTSGGELSFTKIQGAVDARTSGGNIQANGCSDKLQIQTSGGNISIKDYTGPSAQADTAGGNIEVATCAGKLQVRTSGGNIVIQGFSGPAVYADSAGGSITVALEKQPTADSFCRTSGGNISATLAESMALNLNAATDGGSVSSAIPVVAQGKLKEGRLEGKINGGGAVLLLKTSGGDIAVLKQ